MGLSNFPTAAEGVLPVLVMNTVVSVAVLKNIFKSVLQVVVGGASSSSSSEYSSNNEEDEEEMSWISRERSRRRVSISEYKSLIGRRSNMVEWCCVCLCGFEENEQVSELPCKHFFHTGCLDKWFHNKHSTCPLCRSIQ